MPRSGVAHLDADFRVPLQRLISDVSELQAEWSDGTAVAGQLEMLVLQDIDETVASPKHSWIWRPDAPLDRSGVLEISMHIANTGECSAGTVSHTIDVVDDPAEPYVPPAVTAVSGVFEATEPVCCDGALPRVPTDGHLVLPPEIEWEEGYCIVPRSLEQGFARIRLDDSGDRLQNEQWVARVWDGDTLVTSGLAVDHIWLDYHAPFESAIEFEHLGTGQIVMGDSIAMPGEVAIDSAPVMEAWEILQQQCDGTPYRCGARLDQGQSNWSDSHCNDVTLEGLLDDGAHEDGDDTGGCSCTAARSEASTGAMLWLLVLVAGRRRQLSPG